MSADENGVRRKVWWFPKRHVQHCHKSTMTELQGLCVLRQDIDRPPDYLSSETSRSILVRAVVTQDQLERLLRLQLPTKVIVNILDDNHQLQLHKAQEAVV